MNILALDPATKCGWAHSCGASGTWDLSVRRDESAGMRLIRFRGKLEEIRNGTGIDLIVYEAARNAGPRMQGALVVHAELQGTLKLFCEQANLDYRGYSPVEIKKFATGKGNANKEQMVEALAERMGIPYIMEQNNEVDAVWLLLLAQEQYAHQDRGEAV